MQSVTEFLEGISSEATKEQYNLYLNKWFEFAGNPANVQQKVIEFLLKLKKEGKSKQAIENWIAPIKTYYQLNDVILNVKLIDRYLPEYKRARKDRAYEREEISKLLAISDERMKVIILLMASSGIRIGAIPSLQLKNLDGSKLTVYENSNDEYFSFITPECKKAVDSYLDMRSRYGEKLSDESLLVRDQFDVRDFKKPKQLTKPAIHWKIYDLCKRSGINKKDVAIAHGFRKFFMNQCVNVRMNPEIREMLLGHKIGLASAYYRPTEQEMYAEYEKAIDSLTINEENRLRRKVEVLTMDESRLVRLERVIERLEKKSL